MLSGDAFYSLRGYRFGSPECRLFCPYPSTVRTCISQSQPLWAHEPLLPLLQKLWQWHMAEQHASDGHTHSHPPQPPKALIGAFSGRMLARLLTCFVSTRLEFGTNAVPRRNAMSVLRHNYRLCRFSDFVRDQTARSRSHFQEFSNPLQPIVKCVGVDAEQAGVCGMCQKDVRPIQD
jgi:hypothetical protein